MIEGNTRKASEFFLVRIFCQLNRTLQKVHTKQMGMSNKEPKVYNHIKKLSLTQNTCSTVHHTNDRLLSIQRTSISGAVQNTKDRNYLNDIKLLFSRIDRDVC